MEPLEFKNKFSGIFESALLKELESSAMVMNINSGQVLLRIGKPISGVPLVISGSLKISRENDEGQELLLYYVTERETCPMSLTCSMTSQLSSINGTAEEDSVIWVVPSKLIDELFLRFPSWKKFVMNTILDGLTEVIKTIDEVAFKKMDE